MLRISITAGGVVSHIEVAETSGYAILDEAASEAVGRWRFAPARRNGEAVAWTARLPVRFRLN